MSKPAGRPPLTGLAYSPAFERHQAGAGHPERPERVRAIVQHLEVTDCWADLAVWEPQPCADETLALVHTPAHIARVRGVTAGGGGSFDPDTHASPESWEAALRAVGACVEAAERVAAGRLRNAYCVVRPPGHHATPTRAMGFCLFSNVAIAAEWLRRSRRAERVAILDYDVHHGNGTQDVFYARDDVLYVSTHQYPFYPGTGHVNERGTAAGTGYTLNLPLPAGSGDLVYLAALEQVIQPAVRRYRPDFLLLSLGFDAFWDDPLAMQRVSIDGGYSRLVASAAALADELCDGRLVVALEGGYHLGALAHGSEAVCRRLLGQVPPADPLGPAPAQRDPAQAQPLLAAVRDLHRL